MNPFEEITPLLIKSIIHPSPVNTQIYNDEGISGKNEFLFFIKPEITIPSDTIQLTKIIRLIESKINKFRLSVATIRIINAAYLKKHSIIAQHYGVINKISANVRKNISKDGIAKFEQLYSESFENAEIYGSIEFLNQYPHFTPTGLSLLWQNSPTEKLAGGTYAQKLVFDGKSVYLINGFHPRQLEHFIADDRSIVVFTLKGDISWKAARNNFIGKTNPGEAETGSIRNELLQRKKEFGLSEVSSSWNGVHLSAGPVEGLVELLRYNSDFESGSLLKSGDFEFGKILDDAFGTEKMQWLIENPTVEFNGNQISIFDLTEELDSDVCIDTLKKVIADE